MITNIWLKSQPKKKICYPDCFPVTNFYDTKSTDFVGGNYLSNVTIYNSLGYRQSVWLLKKISRVEFRPE